MLIDFDLEISWTEEVLLSCIRNFKDELEKLKHGDGIPVRNFSAVIALIPV